MPLWGGPRVRRATSPPPPRKRSSRHRESRDGERRDRSRDRSPEPPRRKSDSYHSSSSDSRSRRRLYADASLNRSAAAFGDSRSSLPYPQFSKAHSREALGKDEISSRERKPFTPDPTDLSTSRPTRVERKASAWKKENAPPSPPSTAAGSGELNPVQARRKERKNKEGSPAKHLRFSASGASLRNLEEGRSNSTSPRSSLQQPRSATPVGGSPLKGDTESVKTSARASQLETTVKASAAATDSPATHTTRKESDKAPTLLSQRGPSPDSEQDSQPRTPQHQDVPYVEVPGSRKQTPVIEVFASVGSQSEVDEGTLGPGSSYPEPPPPPPPPPGMAQRDVPRVDYLLQHGGLSKQIPRNFSSAIRPPPPQSYQQYAPAQTALSRAADMNQALAPYLELLDQFEQVMSRNGSVAVATGYKSVARRLLDRLETVFSRNISSELCGCVMCNLDRASHTYNGDKDTGVSWGEVLELVSGRRDLPQWPPFSLPTTSNGLSLEGLDHEAPMQKLDIDVPEEYREHYIRQSKKTKQSVDRWLASQPEDQASPPTEVDDETLSFAMLTYLEPSQRRVFMALIRGLADMSDPRAPTPAPREGDQAPAINPDVMPRAARAIQRLYRLAQTPRDPECAMYLLKNPSLHSALATLAAISDDEWDILVSGRFDGFLISGAESRFPSMGPVPARGATPFSRSQGPPRGGTPSRNAPSRGPTMTPFQNGSAGTHSPGTPGPVQMDEETEIAVLAEVEREIYLGMDALEDAMEALHLKAETVRNALRERSAGLSQQALSRKSVGEELRAVMGTPFVGVDDNEGSGSGYGTPTARGPGTPAAGVKVYGLGWDSEYPMMDDAESLLPCDSASNIGAKERSRHRHRKRRPRRMTEALEEEGSQ